MLRRSLLVLQRVLLVEGGNLPILMLLLVMPPLVLPLLMLLLLHHLRVLCLVQLLLLLRRQLGRPLPRRPNLPWRSLFMVKDGRLCCNLARTHLADGRDRGCIYSSSTSRGRPWVLLLVLLLGINDLR